MADIKTKKPAVKKEVVTVVTTTTTTTEEVKKPAVVKPAPKKVVKPKVEKPVVIKEVSKPIVKKEVKKIPTKDGAVIEKVVTTTTTEEVIKVPKAEKPVKVAKPKPVKVVKPKAEKPAKEAKVVETIVTTTTTTEEVVEGSTPVAKKAKVTKTKTPKVAKPKVEKPVKVAKPKPVNVAKPKAEKPAKKAKEVVTVVTTTTTTETVEHEDNLEKLFDFKASEKDDVIAKPVKKSSSLAKKIALKKPKKLIELPVEVKEEPKEVNYIISSKKEEEPDDLITSVIKKIDIVKNAEVKIEETTVTTTTTEVKKQMPKRSERKVTKFSDIYGKPSSVAGKVISLTNDVIDVEFGKNKTPQIGTILLTETDAVLSVEAVINDTTVRCVVISQDTNIALSEKVYSTNKPLQAPVGNEVLGRLFNVFGQPIDGKELSKKQIFKDVEIVRNKDKKEFILKDKKVVTGIKVIDFFLPILEGDKMGMFGGAGVGKTLVIKEIINNLTTRKQNANSIFVGIGERSREGEELYRELYESNLIDKVALVFAQMNDTPGARMKVIYSALTMAEYFRDVMSQNTYMFIDNVYRYIQAGSEISSSLGRINAQSGYQPTLATEVSTVQERISNSSNGTITAFETVFVPADDITDPAVVAIFSHLDGTLVLDRKIAAEGKYPAISPLKSTSNNLQESVVGKRHMEAVAAAKKYLQRYEELSDLIAVLGQDSLSQEDKNVVVRARMLSNFFTQNFFVAETFTQRSGHFVKVEDTISGVEKIIRGDFDSLDPVDFLYIATVDELEQKLADAKHLEMIENESKNLTKRQLKKQENDRRKELKNQKITQIIDARSIKK